MTNLESSKPVDVRRTEGALVAAFHRADPPLVWRFDLERNHSFSLALQGEDGDWELGLTSQKGEFYPVARFTTREDAEDAFAGVEKVLAKGRHSALRGALKIAGIVTVAALALATAFTLMVTYNVMHLASHYPGAETQAQGAAPPAMKNGVPLPADQYLRPPPLPQ